MKIGRIAYAALAMAAIVLAGYFLSPFFGLGERLAEALSKSGDARFECRSSMLSLPFGLVLERFAVTFGGKKESRFEANPMIVKPVLAQLLTGRLVLAVHAETHDGQLDGKIDFIRYFAARGPLKASFRLEEIDLGQSPYLKSLAGKPVSGKLTGTIDFTGDSADLLKGSGRALVKVKEGDFRGFNGQTFNTAEAEIVFEQGTVRIGRLLLDGEEFKCSLKGNIFLNQDPGKSELALNGDLQMRKQPDLKMMLAVTGTIAEPIFTAM